MNCPQCGVEALPGQNFCRQCGAALTANASGSPRYAGFWLRVVASLIDGLIIQVVWYIVFSPVTTALCRALSISPGSGMVGIYSPYLGPLMLVNVVVDWLFQAFFESSGWQATPGKRALGLVVTDLGGGRISFWRATARFFAAYLSLLSLGIGFIMAGFTQKKQAMHDFIAGTLVARH